MLTNCSNKWLQFMTRSSKNVFFDEFLSYLVKYFCWDEILFRWTCRAWERGDLILKSLLKLQISFCISWIVTDFTPSWRIVPNFRWSCKILKLENESVIIKLSLPPQIEAKFYLKVLNEFIFMLIHHRSNNWPSHFEFPLEVS